MIKDAKKTGKKIFVDANSISDLITSTIWIEKKDASVEQNIFKKEIAMQLEIKKIEKLIEERKKIEKSNLSY